MTVSIAAALTDLACTSKPILVRSMNTGASYACRHRQPIWQVIHDSLHTRGPGLNPQPKPRPPP
ncbi:hypothetical protein BN11_730002 [Nostocoides australiense Ben110]|uniref:Uncharacterized protein n=1 Tax=Nostocoides australiense Ben110 TaxID=1193182 RepID=W6JYZ5_9MICO|nr:hypothetical protein BN11_100002 [Tetrasphaera australiensis Ben110]CCH72619.1 hypothetical protein BN11_1820002 [Tetrasphaera australiensis Ben110]CCH73895.1 hypothetical protein BN11_3470008 [Tetrasphaera australiensis Ben110]CCH74871.1 hypothetical protein BN11_4910011 [Tetrasphaera australiensis Ben110]CCH75470.1 hypothetical protein BN11_730002 [Tetrasphaera australiensis Ben110]